MYKEIIVLLTQTLYNIFKVLEIKYTYQNKTVALLLNSVWINLVALASTYYTIDDLLKGNFTIIIFYITGSVLGKYLGMQFGNPRNKIWKTLFKK
jgi:putative effector of murein hydrolase